MADQDDIWVENRVSVFMKVLEKADFVTSNFSIIDEMDELIEELYYDGNPYDNPNVVKILKIFLLGDVARLLNGMFCRWLYLSQRNFSCTIAGLD